MSIAIRFEHVWKRYMDHSFLGGGFKNYVLNAFRNRPAQQNRAVLEDISFEIKQGSTVGFVGRNGVGKSTLLGLIAGVFRPDSGTITVNGRISSMLELGAGFHPDLSGRENIQLYGVVLGFSRREIRRRLDSVISFAELEDSIDVPLRFYSSGMIARLGFAVASQLDPEILLVDEVLAVGDHAFQLKCFDVIERFRGAGGTIVLVSHAADDITRLCDQAYLIENHRIVASGDPVAVMGRYQPEPDRLPDGRREPPTVGNAQ
jgi:homopolymeric O-antigen transport system ATP-binding protein